MSDEFVELESLELTPRRENRAAAMQYVYMCKIAGDKNTPELATDFFTAKSRGREFYSFAEELVAGVYSNLSKIDERIAKAAENWSLERISKVDLSILRVAVFEMFYRDDIPSVVSINEAIELSKLFSSADSKRFVNGILDKLKLSAPRKSSEKK